MDFYGVILSFLISENHFNFVIDTSVSEDTSSKNDSDFEYTKPVTNFLQVVYYE